MNVALCLILCPYATHSCVYETRSWFYKSLKYTLPDVGNVLGFMISWSDRSFLLTLNNAKVPDWSHRFNDTIIDRVIMTQRLLCINSTYGKVSQKVSEVLLKSLWLPKLLAPVFLLDLFMDCQMDGSDQTAGPRFPATAELPLHCELLKIILRAIRRCI